MSNKTVKGYKVTKSDYTCRGFKYEVGKSYEHKGEISLCNSGFHYCEKPAHCFNYYGFDMSNKVFEIEASGNIINGDDKSVTNNIKIIREIEWSEVLRLVNDGIGNTGCSNTGNSNTGNWNTGYRNTGYRNTGDRNTGDSNTGDSNTGNRNTGNSNTGNWNTGNRNTGYRNTGNWNTGNRNTGYSNTGNRNTGAFCTIEPSFPMFNKDTDWTERDFKNSRAYLLLCEVNTKMWIPPSQMTDEEKKANPSWETVDGYLKDIPFKEAFTNAWHNWNEANRNAFKELPNFDAKVFQEITGVDVNI